MSKLQNLANNTESDIRDTQIATDKPEKKKPRGRPFQKGNKFGGMPMQKKEGLSLPSYIRKKQMTARH